MPVTAIKFFGFLLNIFELNLASKFLGFLKYKYKILFFQPLFFNLSEIIIFDPLLIASLINKLPSVLDPLKAKKIYPFLFPLN